MLTGLIENNFTGFLTIWDIKCSFSFSKGYLLEIRPVESDSALFQNRCKEQNGNYDAIDWIYGTSSDDDYAVAFLPMEHQGPMCYYKGTLTLVIGIILEVYNVKGTDGNYLYPYKDLHGFNAIDFSGKPVDAIFSPKAAIIRNSIDELKISWYPSTKYSKVFDVTIHDVPCKLIFTIIIDRQDRNIDSTSLGSIHSIIRLSFTERQDLSMIYPCWQAVCSFLSFCVGQHNVTNLNIGLLDEAIIPGIHYYFGDITCVVNDDKDEDIGSIYPAYYRFQVCSLGEKAAYLFQVLNNAKQRPTLGFLPRTDSDHSVDRYKIRDLCTALEVEFDLRKEKLLEPWIYDLIKQLSETAKQFRNNCPNVFDDSEFNYIQSSINAISKPTRKKILFLYDRYKSIINKHIQYLQSSAYTIDISDDATADDIGWIIKTRNRITHTNGIIEKQIPNMIYRRLTIAVFCSVLERAGYDLQEIATIIDDYFNGNTRELFFDAQNNSEKNAIED